MNTSTALIPFDWTSPVASLESYKLRIMQIPMLSKEQELELATRYHQNNDLQAAKMLVLSHLRFVVRIASDYAGYGLGVGDLIQEGNIGLMKAVKRFDPSLGVRLASFAVHWIKSEIHEFVLKNWRIVKIATTKAQRKLFFNLRKFKPKLGWLSQEEIHTVSQELSVPVHEVVEMEKRLRHADLAFDISPEEEEDGRQSNAPAYYLEDAAANPLTQLEQDQNETHSSEQLAQALLKLDPRLRLIIQKRWLNEKKSTLHQLAEELKLSPERVRQLEQNAFKAIKNDLHLFALES